MSSFINPGVKTPILPVGVTWARLEAVTNKALAYDFLVNPEEVSWSHQSSFKELLVLYTSQPQLAYQNSQTGLSLPKVLLWTPGHSGSLKTTIEQLKQMTKPSQDGKPPILKLTWGNLVEPRLYLKTFSLKEQQWRQGTVTSATASMEFFIVPLPPTVQKSDNLPQLSTRERKDYEVKIKDALQKDKNRAKNLGVDPAKGVTVGADGSVSYGSKKISTLKDKFLDLLKPGHKNL